MLLLPNQLTITLFFLLFALFQISNSQSPHSNLEVDLLITNESPVDLEIGWVNPDTDEIMHGNWYLTQEHPTLSMNSFMGHRFAIVNNESRDLIAEFVCRQEKQQYILIKGDLSIQHYDASQVQQTPLEQQQYEYTNPWFTNYNKNTHRKVMFVNDSKEPITLSADDGGKATILAQTAAYFILKLDKSIYALNQELKISLAWRQVFFLNENIRHVELTPSLSNLEPKDYKKVVSAEVRELLNSCSSLIQDKAFECMKSLTTSHIYDKSQELQKMTQLRNHISDSWETHTCADSSLPTTKPIKNSTFTHKNQSYNVSIMHSQAASKIHYVHNFIKPEECDAMEESAKDNLYPASTEGDSAGERSKSRKAMQAGIDIPWHLEFSNASHPIAHLARRVLNYVNYATNFNLDIFGQEPLMAIQYKGSNDTWPDQYLPHCDGACDGQDHKLTGRVATMVLYCVVPEKGGATNFKNAGIHVVPKAFDAVFFSYFDSKENKMDNGYTTHSGCPVYEGEKKLVTQWLRYGVDTEKTWEDHSAMGHKETVEDEFVDMCKNPNFETEQLEEWMIIDDDYYPDSGDDDEEEEEEITMEDRIVYREIGDFCPFFS